MPETRCLLCLDGQVSLKLQKPSGQKYWDCSACGLIFLDPAFHLAPTAEKAHYLTHQNDIHDPRYQQFVAPVVDAVLQNVQPGASGLDFGAGPGPVVTYLLKSRGYDLHLFDPYFGSDEQALARTYDFIVASEVVEHFQSPAAEFQNLKRLLRPAGPLIIMTHPYSEQTDFETWYYHRDPTHVAFYRMRTFEWIRRRYGFVQLTQTHERVIVLS